MIFQNPKAELERLEKKLAEVTAELAGKDAAMGAAEEQAAEAVASGDSPEGAFRELEAIRKRFLEAESLSDVLERKIAERRAAILAAERSDYIERTQAVATKITEANSKAVSRVVKLYSDLSNALSQVRATAADVDALQTILRELGVPIAGASSTFTAIRAGEDAMRVPDAQRVENILVVPVAGDEAVSKLRLEGSLIVQRELAQKHTPRLPRLAVAAA